MSKKNKYGLYNFGRDDRHPQCWRSFCVDDHEYDLIHLDSRIIECVGKAATYTVFVTYSHHCFSRYQDGFGVEWVSPSPKDKRHFNIKRYQNSIALPAIIEGLMGKKVSFGREGSYVVIECTVGADTEYYRACFDVFKSEKKLRLHVTTANLYSRKVSGKASFEAILKGVLSGKVVKSPQGGEKEIKKDSSRSPSARFKLLSAFCWYLCQLFIKLAPKTLLPATPGLKTN